MKYRNRSALFLFMLLAPIMYITGCNGDDTDNQTLTTSSTTTTSIPENIGSHLIHPDDLTFKGSFRLPEGAQEPGWEYSGYAMTHYPDGDPDGAADGYPGSLFIVGHDHDQDVAEIAIPAPVISDNKSLEDLPAAHHLQDFHDVRNNFYGYLEIPRAGLQYLPAQALQTSGKLYFCWGQHFEDEQSPTHGWCGINLSDPQPAGPWHFGMYTNYVTCDYLFSVPDSWADTYAPGQLLASGRFRDGTWGGRGPALFVCAPWNDGNPPAQNATLSTITPLLLYGTQQAGALYITSSEDMEMHNFKEADEWSGGAWLTAGDKSAVALVGTKATGSCWYGFANGVEYPISGDPGEQYPDVPPWPYDDRGWWSEGISAQIIFFDPRELGQVAAGELETYEPQPYAALDINEQLFDPVMDPVRSKRYLLGAAAFDRQNGLLYIVERRADGDKSLIHVWGVE